MPTMHIESNKEDISDVVLMPGDPNRAKYIAENFLDNVKIVNSIRNLTAYTGYYKGRKVTIFPSGIGIPSACLYTYELYNFYDVKKIIRIGTAGAYSSKVKVSDIVLSSDIYSLSNYPKLYDSDEVKEIKASEILNKKIIETSKRLNINLNIGKTITSDVFEWYIDMEKFKKNFPQEEFLACEMEGFGILYLASKLNREASVLMSVINSEYENKVLTNEERKDVLNKMILLALESII
ncbi:MAG: purine-nucleoside phosphorylase [Bacilli bacterium]